MEMIELKPWINRARANTPASDALAQSMKRGEAARKRTNELDSRTSSAARRARSRFSGVEFDARDDVINEMSRRLSAAGRSNVSEPRRVIRSALTDANYGVAVRRVLGPGQGVIEGPISQRSDRVVKKFGRPSPASMESSIVRRGSLMEREYIKGGKAAGMDVKRFPKQQLRMGTKVEHEHTPKAGIAQEIAKDHLAEFPDYYTRLRKMEHKAARALHGKRGGKMRELKHEITESAIQQSRLKEMIELKPWINRARANTPEAARLVLNNKRMGSLERRANKAVAAYTAFPADAAGRKRAGKASRLYRRVERTLNTHSEDLMNAATDRQRNSGANAVTRPIAQNLSSANAQMLDPRLRSRLDLSPTMEPLSGRKMKGKGRPSPASVRPEGPQDLRGKSAGSQLYPWQKESSIVRRGILLESK